MNQVSLNTWVRLLGFDPGEEETFRIVDDGHANVLENEIPISSPLARAIDGSEAGDKVKFHAPKGELELTILEIGPL